MDIKLQDVEDEKILNFFFLIQAESGDKLDEEKGFRIIDCWDKLIK